MERPYAQDATDKVVSYFFGIEVEKTKHFGKKTLFLVIDNYLSPQGIVEILTKSEVEHIYIGANHSYKHGYARALIDTLLENYPDLAITVEVPVEYLSAVTNKVRTIADTSKLVVVASLRT